MSPDVPHKQLMFSIAEGDKNPRWSLPDLRTLHDPGECQIWWASRREDITPSPGKPFLQCWAADVVRILSKLLFMAQAGRGRKE